MTAAVAVTALVCAAWALNAEGRRRHRWREAERLSRCLFAAAGMRRKWR